MTSVMLIAVIIAMQMVLRRLLPLLCPVPCMAGWCSYEGCVAARLRGGLCGLGPECCAVAARLFDQPQRQSLRQYITALGPWALAL